MSRPTCRCSLCCRNDAGSNRQRKSYFRVGILPVPESKDFTAEGWRSKSRQIHKLRRTREKRIWKYETQSEIEER